MKQTARKRKAETPAASDPAPETTRTSPRRSTPPPTANSPAKTAVVLPALKRTKEVSDHLLVRQATNYSKTTKQLADEMANKYGLCPDEKLNCLRAMRTVRLSQKRLSTLIRRQYRFTGGVDAKYAFLQSLDEILMEIEARSSESDDD